MGSAFRYMDGVPTYSASSTLHLKLPDTLNVLRHFIMQPTASQFRTMFAEVLHAAKLQTVANCPYKKMATALAPLFKLVPLPLLLAAAATGMLVVSVPIAMFVRAEPWPAAALFFIALMTFNTVAYWGQQALRAHRRATENSLFMSGMLDVAILMLPYLEPFYAQLFPLLPPRNKFDDDAAMAAATAAAAKAFAEGGMEIRRVAPGCVTANSAAAPKPDAAPVTTAPVATAPVAAAPVTTAPVATAPVVTTEAVPVATAEAAPARVLGDESEEDKCSPIRATTTVKSHTIFTPDDEAFGKLLMQDIAAAGATRVRKRRVEA